MKVKERKVLSMGKILESSNLCKTYYSNDVEFHALKNVNLEINQGEFVAIMGKSGSGKSTLLYTLSGMDEITGGEVYLKDKKINNLTMEKIENELKAIKIKYCHGGEYLDSQNKHQGHFYHAFFGYFLLYLQQGQRLDSRKWFSSRLLFVAAGHW